MDTRSLQREIENYLNKLVELQRESIASSSTPEAIQEFISGLKILYEKALDLQHQYGIQRLQILEAEMAAKFAAVPHPQKAQPVHIDSLIPKGPAIQAEIKAPIQEVLQVVEQIAAAKPMHSHPSMDELLMAAANKTAEANQAQESIRRKKVITDIHDKFDEVPTFAGRFNDQETLAKRMAGTKQQNGLAEKHQHKPISDLKSAIGINEKFLFINHLFSGDTQAYLSSIELLNTSANIEIARAHVNQNLVIKYDWDISSHPANLFVDLVERRFIS
ncbi:MAG: hypothetical protein EYC69_10925 [Bacteroidetes bacterium]|nr:MAG: hypothetical protein EYC69_10925 [Bacteroidota bacterium]